MSDNVILQIADEQPINLFVGESEQPISLNVGEVEQPIVLSIDQPGERGPQGPAGAGDAHFEASLSGETDLTVAHNLNKYPALSVIDSAGDEVEGEYIHLDTNTTRLRFSAGFSGIAVFN